MNAIMDIYESLYDWVYEYLLYNIIYIALVIVDNA